LNLKIEELSKTWVALASGNTGYATEILNNSRKKICGFPKPEVAQIMSIVKEEYATTRRANIDETIVRSTLGNDFIKFADRGMTLPAYLQSQANVYQQIIMLSQQLNLVVDIIIAGIDLSDAHISVVIHPGLLVSLDKLGYGAIGSGGIHATTYLSLHSQTSQSTLLNTLYSVYAAKKVSEVAPGVGRETDIAIIETDRIVHCEKLVLTELEKLFSLSNNKPSPELDTLEKLLEGKVE